MARDASVETDAAQLTEACAMLDAGVALALSGLVIVPRRKVRQRLLFR
jgi:hypothetical protein